MTCREAIKKVFDEEVGVLTTSEVIAKINARHPEQPWKDSTISAHLIGLSVNHPSSRHYPSVRQHGFLFSLGNGRYRLWNKEEDGVWVLTPNGVELLDDEVSVDQEEVEDAGYGMSLSLEKDLENSLITSLSQLESGLKLYQGDGIHGRQFDTGVVGRIDILALDSKGRYVAIELKAGEADEKVFGQILRYMGWVKRELAKESAVRGIIVASSFTEKAKYAAEAVPNVILKRYEVQFRFKDVGIVGGRP